MTLDDWLKQHREVSYGVRRSIICGVLRDHGACRMNISNRTLLSMFCLKAEDNRPDWDTEAMQKAKA
jgi:hypothetical protein